jgi:hypothetical protein
MQVYFSLRSPLIDDLELQAAVERHYCLRVTTTSEGYDTFIATNDFGALYVVKAFSSHYKGVKEKSAKRDREIQHWYSAYKLRLPAITVDTCAAMVMPLVLTFSEWGDPPDVSPEGLRKLLFQHPDCEADVSLLRELSEQLVAAGASDWTARDALQVAIEDLTRNDLSHDNLKWCHVGLMPIFGNDPKYASMVAMASFSNCTTRTAAGLEPRLITSVHPVFIDLDHLVPKLNDKSIISGRNSLLRKLSERNNK